MEGFGVELGDETGGRRQDARTPSEEPSPLPPVGKSSAQASENGKTAEEVKAKSSPSKRRQRKAGGRQRLLHRYQEVQSTYQVLPLPRRGSTHSSSVLRPPTLPPMTHRPRIRATPNAGGLPGIGEAVRERMDLVRRAKEFCEVLEERRGAAEDSGADAAPSPRESGAPVTLPETHVSGVGSSL